MSDEEEVIKKLQTVPEIQKDCMKAALQEFKRSLPEIVELQSIIAAIQRERYLRLIENGFTDEQAIKIISKITVGSF